MRLAPVVLLSAFLPTAAAASTSSGLTVSDHCTASRLITCASVQVQYLRMGATVASVLTIRGSVGSAELKSEPVTGFRFTPLFGQGLSQSPGGPQILAIFWDDDGRPKQCRPGGEDCRLLEEPITTPEPVTMTLLASGLVGLAGANRWLRRSARRMHDV